MAKEMKKRKRAASLLIMVYRFYLRRQLARAARTRQKCRYYLYHRCASIVESAARGRLGRRRARTFENLRYIKNRHPISLKKALAQKFEVKISASRGAAAPSRHRRASSPGMMEVGGFFSEFEAVRTESSDRDAPRRWINGQASRSASRRSSGTIRRSNSTVCIEIILSYASGRASYLPELLSSRTSKKLRGALG